MLTSADENMLPKKLKFFICPSYRILCLLECKVLREVMECLFQTVSRSDIEDLSVSADRGERYEYNGVFLAQVG